MSLSIAIGTTVAIGAVSWEVVQTIRRAVKAAGRLHHEQD